MTVGKKFWKGVFIGLIFSIPIWFAIYSCFAYEGRDWNGDGDIDCIFGSFDNGECRPCYGVDLMIGRVVCSDDEPYAGAKVKFTNMLTKQISWVETGKRGWYYKLAVNFPFPFSYYKVQFAGQSRCVFNFGFCTPRFIKPFEGVICSTKTTTSTSTLPLTTSISTTTTAQATTTVSPSTSTVLATSTIQEETSTTIPVETTTTSTESTTTTSIQLKCEMACKLMCYKIPFDNQGYWEQTPEIQECFKECMKDCTPVKGWERTK